MSIFNFNGENWEVKVGETILNFSKYDLQRIVYYDAAEVHVKGGNTYWLDDDDNDEFSFETPNNEIKFSAKLVLAEIKNILR